MVHKGESACVEVSKEIYTIAVKEWSAKKSKRLGVSLFEYLVLIMLVQKGENTCVEVSKDIYTKKAKRSDVSLFYDLVNKLQQRVYL